ncbi:MAG: orotidine-5'-phosphate decarboxylase [Eubacteriales bacterium]|nr:orotidine-5'-phosphate decarboxylase [Eubacteriales bacterium]
MPKDVIIACDFSSEDETMNFLEKFGDERPYVKIGMELFYGTGPDMVRKLKARGHSVFLDLKLHDIPNTVGRAMAVISTLGVDMCNVHAAGAKAMMSAAAAEAKGLVIGVTQLTSTSEKVMREEILIEKPLKETVIQYALNCKEAGLKGVVCSPLEAEEVHRACGYDFLTVTPGIRLEGDAKGDQKRVTTPAMARELGSDYIVVGRSITAAADPLAAYERCRKEFLG